MLNSFPSGKSAKIPSSANNIDSIHKLSTAEISEFITKTNPASIEKTGQRMALNLFRNSSDSVPAYRKFLKTNHIDSSKIRNLDDFKTLPIMTKKNYLLKYPLAELNWDGKLDDLHIVSVSSGSSGEPFFWPRGQGLELETALIYELALKHIFRVDRQKTLFLIGYAMGMYVAGVFTLNSLMKMTREGYPLTVVSPGSDKDQIITIIKKLGSNFDQVIIAAYPPVIKDVVDKGIEENINWKDYKMKFISGGEGYSEEFRSYVYKKMGTLKSYLTSSMNTYGSADAAILGHETPLSILVRKAASDNSNLRKALFGEDRLPSVQQYYPFYKYFESVDGNLVFTTFGGIPLIRYSIGDTGGIIPYKKVIDILDEFKIDIRKEMKKYHSDNLIWKLPFVYLFGRKDNTKIFYGANIYPEHIKNCLEQKKLIGITTGKYFMDIIFDKDHNQSLLLAIELCPKVKNETKLEDKIAKLIHNNLLNINDEYRYLFHTIGNIIYPKVELYEYGHLKYFSPRIKPKYVKKD